MISRHTLLAPAVLALAAAACSAAPTREPVAPTMVEEEEEAREPDWKILRADYETAVKDGLQKIMRWYFVQPAYDSDAFVGYRVMEIYREELRKGPIRTGDVILRINRGPVERPEHVLEIYRDLWGRKNLELELLRDGKPKTYVIPVIE